MKSLLTILICLFLLGANTVCSQIITVFPAGRKTLAKNKEIAESLIGNNHDPSEMIRESANALNIAGPDNYEVSVKPLKTLSAPLLSRLFVTSDFGGRYHPVFQKCTFHTGIDLRANYDTVYSIATGFISKEGYNDRAGNFLVIQHGNGIESIYCHLSSFLMRTGDPVFAGTKVAISGASGAVTGPHLHFAIKVKGKFTDPVPILKAIEDSN